MLYIKMRRPLLQQLFFGVVFWAAITIFSGFSWTSPVIADFDPSEYVQTEGDLYHSVCRVVCVDQSGHGQVGSGVVVLRRDGKYWVLTNHHVMERFEKARLDFNGDGELFSVNAVREASYYDQRIPYDFAVLTVNEKDLAPYRPKIVPLASIDSPLNKDLTIISAGCPGGRRPQLWKGRVESYFGRSAIFYPAPLSGQSGSAICQRNTQGFFEVVLVLTWRVGDERTTSEEDMRGGAIPIKHLYWAISGKRGVSELQSIGEYFTECSQTDKKPLFTECSEKTATTTKNVPQSVPPTSTIAVEEARNVFLPKEENDRGEKKMYKMFYFTSKYCVPCVTFEPILLRLKTEKFLIETISIETRDGEKLFRQAGLQGTPAFAFCSSNDSGKSWVIEEKWSGAPDGTEEKIRKLFNAKKQERSESSAESDWPTSPQVTKSDEPVFIETGDARPLLEEYESGWLSRTSPQEDDTSALRNKDGSTEGSALNQSETGGIINRVAALIARRAQEQIDELIQASGKQIDTLLNDLSETIKTEIKARIAKEVTHETQMFLAKNWLKILIAVVILFYVIGIILNAIAQKFPSTQKWLPRFGGESHESNAAPTESTVTTKTKARTN